MTGARFRVQQIGKLPTPCKGCGQDILWAVTETGRRMPLQPTAVRAEDGTVASADAHWAHCPVARDFRRRSPQQ